MIHSTCGVRCVSALRTANNTISIRSLARPKVYMPTTVLRIPPPIIRLRSKSSNAADRSTSPVIPVCAGSSTKLPTNPNQNEYQFPQTGLLSALPATWVPYAELIRIDKPTGTIYLFLPCLWATLLATTMNPVAVPLSTTLSSVALFGVGAVIMRGAGCTINDFWDRKIDPQVTRTKFRPIARGAIQPKQALVFLGGQLIAGAAVLFSFPMECVVWGIPSLALVATYPLFKRITHYPQVVLGLAYSWGALLGFPAIGLSLADPNVLVTAGCLYVSNVAWTVLYDTIYAHQDLKDDLKAGVKSVAVKHANSTKKIMTALGLVQCSFLAAAGIFAGCGPVFFIGSCGGSAAGLAWMIHRVNLNSVRDCWYWFKWCAVAVGGVAISGGLAAEIAFQKWTERSKIQKFM